LAQAISVEVVQLRRRVAASVFGPSTRAVVVKHVI